jgi:formylglycine-generating enzyme required for sulfatase activity
MLPIPAGEFWMGSADNEKFAHDEEKPRRKVRISQPFLLGRTPITQAQFLDVMGTNPSRFKSANRLKGKDSSQHPVESVRWLDAIRFCNRLSERHSLPTYYQIDGSTVTIRGGPGFRLPTEAEWEYACRGGTTTAWHFGNDPAGLDKHGWHAGNSGDTTHPVASKAANPFGLFDMHGNVPQWCWDRYDPRYYKRGPLSDPPGPGTGATRVFRGGAWNDAASQTRAASRNSLAVGYGTLTAVGLRVARNGNP